MSLFLIDGVAPFFDDAPARKSVRINWSKIPFASLETGGRITAERAGVIVKRFREFARRAAAMGYNAVTIDDVAHLVEFGFYRPEVRRKIRSYRSLYRRIFRVCERAGLRVYLTTDIMFFNDDLEAYTGLDQRRIIHVLRRAFARVFSRHPEVDGIIMRIGESDGLDIQDEFKSRLVIRSPRAARQYITALLPMFERFHKNMVFRTWTMGAYRIGDLIWNTHTYDQVFAGLDSPRLIISQKYGDSDFFRYLRINPIFFRGPQKKIIELQTRREYEGFGEFPSYVGIDYRNYYRQLSSCATLVGCSVWSQTGGWAHFRHVLFRKGTPPWNEINTFVTIQIFRYGLDHDEALRLYAKRYLPKTSGDDLVKFMKLSHEAVAELWYLPEFSTQPLYFRRLRVPPLLWVFWTNIIINHTMRKVLKRIVRNRQEAIDQGYAALKKVKTMKKMTKKMGLPKSSLKLQYDTFRLLALAREYYLGKWRPEIIPRLEKTIAKYEKKHPNGWNVVYDFSPVWVKKGLLKSIFRVTLRSRARYRWVDILFLVRLTGWMFTLLIVWQKDRVPEFARKHAMGIDFLFK